MTNHIESIYRFLKEKNHTGVFVIFLPWKARKKYLAELIGGLNESKMRFVEQVEGYPPMRAYIMKYKDIDFAFIDPERIMIKADEIYNAR